MKQLVFSVYDSKANAYLRPFFTTTKGLALRSFIDAANDPRETINKYPGDYTLFELGEYDDASGTITMHKAHQNMGKANEHIRATSDSNVPTPSLSSLPGNPPIEENNQAKA